METVEKSIEIEAPLHKVYNQWTQFEEFPRFMDGVEQVRQVDSKHLHWVAKIGGKRKEWDAEIVEQIPDERIAWRSTTGAANAGIVNFRPVDHNHTRLTLQLNYQPDGAAEKVGDMHGMLSRRIESDLENFRNFIQQRHTETGAWRGEIQGSQVQFERGYGTSGRSGT